jgi:hypothetical protein
LAWTGLFKRGLQFLTISFRDRRFAATISGWSSDRRLLRKPITGIGGDSQKADKSGVFEGLAHTLAHTKKAIADKASGSLNLPV